MVDGPSGPGIVAAMATFDLQAELDAVTAALDASQIEYAICGALALAVHGHPRATKDIDVLVAPSRTWRDRRVSVVSRAGLTTMKRLAGRPQDLADLAALGEDGEDA